MDIRASGNERDCMRVIADKPDIHASTGAVAYLI